MIRIFLKFFIGLQVAAGLILVAGCGAKSPDSRYDFVGELSTLHTMTAGSVLRLKIGEHAYELELDRETEFIDIRMMTVGADWVIGGEYGVNGELNGARLHVDQITYLGGGEPNQSMLAPPITSSAMQPEPSREPPMFRIDENATGPLTMDELQFNVPASMHGRMSAQTIQCWREAIEEQALEAGDPEQIDPTESEFVSAVKPDQWAALRPHMRRAILAQALMSSALRECQ